ncbi:MAG: isochorismatase family protein [Candidatus Omnitrophica bacterium]|nr:isochorismatase family protein [Candidatus Omnitrophota bacterium]
MFSIENSLLLVIDIQGNLAYQMFQKESLFKNIQTLIQTADILDIPVLYTEQAPEKIGQTVPEIRQFLEKKEFFIKKTFSCAGSNELMARIRDLKRQEIIMIGIETHVCVYQTAVDFKKLNYRLQIVDDAVSSRTEANKLIALERLRFLGVDLTCTESVATELLKSSEHPKFKEILTLIR